MKKLFRRLAIALAGLVAILIIFVGFCFFKFSQISQQNFPLHPELAAELKSAGPGDVELGKRIYSIRSGCVECHGVDLSGTKIMENGAMGSIYGANITPYKLSDWSDVDIVRAVRYGVKPDGKTLRFMPSFDFGGLSAGDLASIVAYLRSVPAVKKESHVNEFGPVAKVMSVLGKMPVVFPAKFIDHNQGLVEKPPEGPTEQFGRYLVSACTGCHGTDLRGGPIPGGDPSWPPAKNIRMGSHSGWTEAEFMNVIKTGMKNGQPIKYPMPVKDLQQMNDTELTALWKYLSTLD